MRMRKRLSVFVLAIGALMVLGPTAMAFAPSEKAWYPTATEPVAWAADSPPMASEPSGMTTLKARRVM